MTRPAGDPVEERIRSALAARAQQVTMADMRPPALPSAPPLPFWRRALWVPAPAGGPVVATVPAVAVAARGPGPPPAIPPASPGVASPAPPGPSPSTSPETSPSPTGTTSPTETTPPGISREPDLPPFTRVPSTATETGEPAPERTVPPTEGADLTTTSPLPDDLPPTGAPTVTPTSTSVD